MFSSACTSSGVCGSVRGTPATNSYNCYVEAHTRGTNRYGIFFEAQTGGTINNSIFMTVSGATQKPLAFRNQNSWISSDVSGNLDLHGTNVDIEGYAQFPRATGVMFYDDEMVSYQDDLVSDTN